MVSLLITQCKPNPRGKDRFANNIPNSQLAGEWLDFKNLERSTIDLSGIVLYHTAYTQAHPNGEWSRMCEFGFYLPSGMTVRIHAGGEVSLNLLHRIDVVGADYHVFTGKSYTLNNDRAEEIGIWQQVNEIWIDKAKYRANPPEGKILIRRGDYLE